MKAFLLTGWLLLFVALSGYAQRDTSFYRTTPVPAHLRPIERAIGSSAIGSVYFYGGKRLTSAASLEIPFFELNDPLVNRHYRNYRTWTTVSRLTALVPLVYFFTRTKSVGFNSGEYWTVYGGSVVLAFGTVIIANTQVNKAVARYNTMLRQVPRAEYRVGAALSPTPLGTYAVGVGGTLRF
ncbi:hypothetical protein ACAW74_11955 [Fibrella sp. WM1]|uniref:hypothetical protein n=1 Tax=Fibrella musci TaxID=3242485 RepID=UPI003520FB04